MKDPSVKKKEKKEERDFSTHTAFDLQVQEPQQARAPGAGGFSDGM